ncbi:Triose phosphate/phosphate translocator, non-green plastid, chloroplastic [Porphyridium purpureum]|uniref:Triose phosphate/phosphate translocator, non-green plastid, chloroplastic n=1 Tax=Porphyridium purpureum TaxID=35688 RepID=A0A5J4YLG5_PORPP|nr:Triose phosphate/phosphate translocator, non-green plastid, chloroplastic [Porphyridium purpureum]|eukprot:POR3049..scf291_13
MGAVRGAQVEHAVRASRNEGGGSGGEDEEAAVVRKQRARLAVMLVLWMVSSLVSLFYSKHALSASGVSDDFFAVWLLLCSTVYGAIWTLVLRVQPLQRLSQRQLKAVVPLSAAYLVKEVLKYGSLGRISVNLFNTIRSLAPIFSALLEFIAFKHVPPARVMTTMIPVVFGVTLTSVEEIKGASANDAAMLLVSVQGLLASACSTGINSGQNIYSKLLFGRDKIDPQSLQVYLSAISFSMAVVAYSVLELYRGFGAASNEHFGSRFLTQLQSYHVSRAQVVVLLLAGLLNFASSQLAFVTLNRISPLSYSVANIFKRVLVPVIAVGVLHEHLTPINLVGVLLSIAGIFLYERATRSYKMSRAYAAKTEGPDLLPATATAAVPTKKMRAETYEENLL